MTQKLRHIYAQVMLFATTTGELTSDIGYQRSKVSLELGIRGYTAVPVHCLCVCVVCYVSCVINACESLCRMYIHTVHVCTLAKYTL